ncbi:MAG: HD domain-containing protein [Planctomycetaceae bacterium]|nr:HD domain-containing protein [Planctomycetaceae bacterium]
MARRFINQLGEHENVDQVFLVSDKQLRTNRNGNLYLQLRLTDRTGSMTAMLWNANDQLYASFDNGTYVRVQATTQFYNGALQMIAQRLERVDPSTIDETDFQTLADTDIDQLASRLTAMLRGVKHYHLRCLAECFLMDEQFLEKFLRAPAGIKNHHAYHGGLVEHVVSLMELTAAVAPLYPELDADLLLMGAFLHDVGKIHELTYDRELGYSDEGQLIGHLVIAVELLDQKIRESQSLCNEPFPEQLRLLLKHMILSHHGEYEFGSPKLPMTREAVALHFLDNLDAKLQLFNLLIQSDANTESNWTPYQPNLGRKLYKATASDSAAEEP